MEVDIHFPGTSFSTPQYIAADLGFGEALDLVMGHELGGRDPGVVPP